MDLNSVGAASSVVGGVLPPTAVQGRRPQSSRGGAGGLGATRVRGLRLARSAGRYERDTM